MNQVKQTTFETGLSASQIKAIIALREETLASIGEVIGEDPDRISDTINRNRRNQRIREKLSRHFNLLHETLWGEGVPAAKNGTHARETSAGESKPSRRRVASVS